MIEVFETKIIPTSGGVVRKYLDINTGSFEGFGEVYFSEVKKNSIKGWKCQLKFFSHICVPVGSVKFVFMNCFSRLGGWDKLSSKCAEWSARSD